MDIYFLGGSLVSGIIIGAAITYLYLRPKIFLLRYNNKKIEKEIQYLSEKNRELEKEKLRLTSKVTELETVLLQEKRMAEEKLAIIKRAEEELKHTFRSLSVEVLKNSNESFLELARVTLEKYQLEAKSNLEHSEKAVMEIVNPIKEYLDNVSYQIKELEKARRETYISLKEQVSSLMNAQQRLHVETERLVRALRSPQVRGRWGEIQLRRVVEIAGMVAYCDFIEQHSVEIGSKKLRPDLVVRLPGKKNIVVDAKAPLSAYLEAMETEDEERRERLLLEHAKTLKRHIMLLSEKAYWEQFDPTPEFVVLFLPGETFFSAALEKMPALIEEGVKRRVILATPTTLIALLRTVAYGWQQEKIAESAQIISGLGRELYDRLGILIEHLGNMGKSLEQAVDAYNKAVSSVEQRIVVTARKLKEVGIESSKKISKLSPIEKNIRKSNHLNDDL